MADDTTPATDRPYHHGSLRDAVVSAALDVLARAEPASLSLRDLARTVGVRHSAIYSHFRDRSDLLAAVAGEGFAALLAELEPPSPGGDPYPIETLAARYVRFARAHPSHYRAMFLPEVSRPENIGRVKPACERCLRILLAALERRPGLSPDEVHERAVGIWSALHGLVLLGDDSGPLHRQIDPGTEVATAVRIVRTLADGRPSPSIVEP